MNPNRKLSGEAVELNIKWGNGTTSWQKMRGQLKEQIPDMISQYALDKNLLDAPGWKWCQDFVHETPMIKILRHFFDKQKIMVEVFADDGLPLVWDIADVDVDLMHS